MPQDGGHDLARLFLAAATIGVGGVAIGLMWLAQRGRIASPEARVPLSGSLVVIAAAASLGAAAIHFAVAGVHFTEWWGYGAFFVVIAWFQTLWAMAAVLRPSSALLAAGAAVNAGGAGLWLWTRTIGLPMGPLAGLVEPIGVLDALATALEVGIVVAALGAWRPERRDGLAVSRVTGLAAQGMAIVLVACATSAALALPMHLHPGLTDHTHTEPRHSAEPTHQQGGESLPADAPPSPRSQPPPDGTTRPGLTALPSPPASSSPEPSHTH